MTCYIQCCWSLTGIGGGAGCVKLTYDLLERRRLAAQPGIPRFNRRRAPKFFSATVVLDQSLRKARSASNIFLSGSVPDRPEHGLANLQIPLSIGVLSLFSVMCFFSEKDT